jgi:hypothetical protein
MRAQMLNAATRTSAAYSENFCPVLADLLSHRTPDATLPIADPIGANCADNSFTMRVTGD